MKTNLVDTGAVTAPVTLAEFKAHARIYHSEDDSALPDTILAATQVIENETRRALITRAFSYRLEAFPENGEIVLPRSPFVAVTSITYNDPAGATQTLNTSYFLSYAVNMIGRVQLKKNQAWPATENNGGLDVTVNFTAGFGAAAANVPLALRFCVLLQAAHMYEHRTSVNVGNIVTEIPRTVERYIVQYHAGDYV
jgi:uncharacterized phiE125 gp8 family phage protein